ncbi:hypothetical protein [Brevundimonas sp. SL130]|uniref:hypothetical protein n=1 Tax=Brevundimonas sp. SL130 TaxID=2995143 RepID=UPI00226D2463|nr:hypothetical protein [Brevundimonas sp. SL130]WAC58677.1 hypothetical protein OU998_10625 [Brevundimonas sp. SL130]
MDEGKRTQLLIARTKHVLRSLFPNNGSVLEEVLAEAERERDRLRFLIKRKKIGNQSVEASFNLATWPAPSDLILVIKDHKASICLSSARIELEFYADAFSLVGDIRREGETVKIVPKTSFTAQLVATRYETSLTLPLTTFRAWLALTESGFPSLR